MVCQDSDLLQKSKINCYVGKLFGHNKEYDSQQMKTQPSVSRYIEILRILLAVNSNCWYLDMEQN